MSGTLNTLTKELRTELETLLRDIKNARKSLSSWTCRWKAAVLAGIAAGITAALDLVDNFGITPKIRAEWGKNKTVMAHMHRLIGQPAT